MILAADFGGTSIKLGLVKDGKIVARAKLPVQGASPMSAYLEDAAKTWETLLSTSACSLQECRGIALALPFLVNSTACRVFGEFGKFRGAADVDFQAWSSQRLGLPIALENDLRGALLGECAAGGARGKSHVVMLSLGTGIGCAAISEGQLVRGAHNRAATLFGHSSVAFNGAVGRCGNCGCAEDLASTATLGERARIRADFAGSALTAADIIDFETVFALAAQGDACAHALVQESLQVWAVVVQNAVLAFDPEVVVLGGGVLRSQEVIIPVIENHLRHYMPGFSSSVRVVASALGDDAALLGGEVLFRQKYPTPSL